MSSLKSDQEFRQAAKQLGVDEKTIRRWLNTADPDELLQRAAAVVVDDDKEVGAVARIFGVNEKHLGKAVWHMKENRAREADELLQRAAIMVIYRHIEVRTVAVIFGVNEEHLRRTVAEKKRDAEKIARQAEVRFAQRMHEDPPS
jgi:transposase-like protein